MKIHVLIVFFVSLYQTVSSSLKDTYKLEYIYRDLKKNAISLTTYIKNNMKKMINSIRDKTFVDYFTGLFSGKSLVRNSNTKALRNYQTDTNTLLDKEIYISNLNMWNSGVIRAEEPTEESAAKSTMQFTTPQLALLHGRVIETHVVKTEDGYFLTVHRVPKLSASNRTVLLHHGLLGSSADWLLLGPTHSLPYILSDAGYDVWIANARGNYYSRGHETLTTDLPEYWNFTFQEIGQYDLPAVIDYIRLVRNNNGAINYIGHSMGATALLVLLSTVPQYNDYLTIGILLAPLAYMNHIQGPIKMMVSLPDEVLKTLGDGEFLPSRIVPSALARKYCKDDQTVCRNPLLFLSGIPKESKEWDINFMNQLKFHIPAGGSLNTILHYIELARTGKFHKFNDHKSQYMVNKITLPLVLFSSNDDWLATVPDVVKLYFFLRNPIDHNIVKDKNMAHTDFVWGREATVFVFNDIVKYLESSSIWINMSSREENDLKHFVF